MFDINEIDTKANLTCREMACSLWNPRWIHNCDILRIVRNWPAENVALSCIPQDPLALNLFRDRDPPNKKKKKNNNNNELKDTSN